MLSFEECKKILLENKYVLKENYLGYQLYKNNVSVISDFTNYIFNIGTKKDIINYVESAIKNDIVRRL